MSLGVVFKGPEGLVLAADSRVTLTAVQQVQAPIPVGQVPGGAAPAAMLAQHETYFDNATKLLTLQGHPNLGIVTYGQGAIGQQQPRMAHGFIPEFETHMAEEHNVDDGHIFTVEEIATGIGKFFGQQWTDAGMPPEAEPMVFLVAGYDPGAAYGKVFEVSIPNAPDPVEKMVDEFGITQGGVTYFAQRLLGGVAPRAIDLAVDELGLGDEQAQKLVQRWQGELPLPIPYQFLPLQDCVDLTTFLVDMTKAVISWTVGNHGVGGDVDVATITLTEGFQSVQQKRIRPWQGGT